MNGTDDTLKDYWPELVGVEGEEAAATIERENRNVTAIIVLDGSTVTADIVCTRVRVWVNTDGIVVRAPRVG